MSNATGLSATRAEAPLYAHRVTLRGRRLGIRTLVVGAGVIGWLFTFMGSWIPSFWGDEAASIVSAERPLSTLWNELGRVDAVHGTYYVFLHFWIELFGASELSVRFPSTVAVGVAVAGTVLLAARLFGTRVAVLAGVVATVLPRVNYMGAEGRSYAIGTAIAVWLTVAFVELVRRRETRRLPWVWLGLGYAVATYVFLYLVLLIVVHGIVLLTVRRPRELFKKLAVALGIALVVASPVIGFALGQHGQISFLDRRNYMTFERLFVLQWFGNPWAAAVGWALVIVGVAASVRRLYVAGRVGLAPGRHGTALAVGVAWLVVPMALLLLGNEFIAPMYTIRYLSFCTPAVAMLVAVGIDAIACSRMGRLSERRRFSGRRRMLVAAVALLAVVGLSMPTDVFQRTQYAKDDGSDLRQVSAVMAANAHAGDAVIFEEGVRPSRSPRLGLHLYPAGYIGLDDVELETSYTQLPGLWDAVAPVSSITGALTTTKTVWALELKSSAEPADVSDLERVGYTVSRSILVHRTVIYELTRAL